MADFCAGALVYFFRSSVDMIKVPHLATQVLDWTWPIARFHLATVLLAGFEEVFGAAIVKVLVDAFRAAQLSDRLFATQAFKDNADLLFRTVAQTGLTADLTHMFFGRRLLPEF